VEQRVFSNKNKMNYLTPASVPAVCYPIGSLPKRSRVSNKSTRPGRNCRSQGIGPLAGSQAGGQLHSVAKGFALVHLICFPAVFYRPCSRAFLHGRDLSTSDCFRARDFVRCRREWKRTNPTKSCHWPTQG
jgi:hypothetical protein